MKYRNYEVTDRARERIVIRNPERDSKYTPIERSVGLKDHSTPTCKSLLILQTYWCLELPDSMILKCQSMRKRMEDKPISWNAPSRSFAKSMLMNGVSFQFWREAWSWRKTFLSPALDKVLRFRSNSNKAYSRRIPINSVFFVSLELFWYPNLAEVSCHLSLSSCRTSSGLSPKSLLTFHVWASGSESACVCIWSPTSWSVDGSRWERIVNAVCVSTVRRSLAADDSVGPFDPALLDYL